MQISGSEIIKAVDINDISFLSVQYEVLQKQQVPDQLTTVTRFLKRCRQLDGISSEKYPLGCTDKVCLALFIEKMIHNRERDSNAYFKKTAFLYPLKPSFSLHYNTAEKASYLLLKRKGNKILNKMGVAKKVTAAIQIPDDTSSQPAIVAQAVNKTSDIMRHQFLRNPHSCDPEIREDYLETIEDIKFAYKLMIDDLSIHKKFSGNTGIWPLLGYNEYTRTLSTRDEIPKVLSFTPLASSADKVAQGIIYLSIDQLIDMAHQVACGIGLLHGANHIHGDIKPENTLFFLLPDGTIRAGLTDFGLSFKTDGLKLSFPLDEGYYGSLVPTAPELFGNKKFGGDIFKTEVWAFGFLLYILLFKELPPWYPLLLLQANDLEKEISDERKSSVIECVKSRIEKPRQDLLDNEQSLSIKEKFTLLIYDMMRLDPELRPGGLAITQRLSQLQEKLLVQQCTLLSITSV